jgi:hypothetical protein
MSTDTLFDCDFSIDELAVLADLLEIPALPGGDPDAEVPEEAKAAAARGLLARRVIVADGAAGSVEITQPYATMIGIVLFATEATTLEDGTAVFRSDDAAVRVSQTAGGALARWTAESGPLASADEPVVARARVQAGKVTIERASTP